MKRDFFVVLTVIGLFTYYSIGAYAQETVDLGLSVKWASCNIGANYPGEKGLYFAWADVDGQYIIGNNWSGDGFSKRPNYQLDEKKNLKPEYDAAHVILGGTWRMPTSDEFQELLDNCTKQWVDNYNSTGASGILFTSKKAGFTDKTIFLPATGEGQGSVLDNTSWTYYWTSSWNGKPSQFYCDSGTGRYGMGYENSYYGMPIRPVSESNISGTSSKKSQTITQRLPNESDYQLQIRQGIMDMLATDNALTVTSSDEGLIVFKEGDIVYRLEIDPYKDDSSLIYTRLYIFSRTNTKYSPAVYNAVRNDMLEYRTIKCEYSRKDGYFVLTSEANVANSDNFNKTFNKTKSLLKKLYLTEVPKLLEQYYYVETHPRR